MKRGPRNNRVWGIVRSILVVGVLALAIGLFQGDVGARANAPVHVWHDDLANVINHFNFDLLPPGHSEPGGGGGDVTDDDSTDGKSNNGHGNNEDGVDSSNPGQGGGGPNGEEDESCPPGGPCVDDEIKDNGGGNDKDKDKDK